MPKRPTIVFGDGTVHALKMQGKTDDIIYGIGEADKCATHYITEDISALMGATLLDTCRNIFDFVRDNIPYNEDEEGKQWIQSPGELWNNRHVAKGGTGEGGDCKSMSIFCAAILKSFGNYDFSYRFISEKPDEDFYHVYLVVYDGSSHIALDPTVKKFNHEISVAKLMDMPPAPADAPCNFPPPFNNVRISGIGYTPGDTAYENSGQMWRDHENSYKTTYVDDGSYVYNLQTRVINEIAARFSNAPAKRNQAEAFVRGDMWYNHMKSSCLMIYKWWGDPGFFKADYTAAIPDIANVDLWIGQTEITFKRQNAIDCYDDLRNIGLSDASIKELANYSCYNNFGITMPYMLYRCYNKLTYGQEWGPAPGIPYYDANTKTFHPNGANINDFNYLQLAFPLEGGTGKPWGLPYIAKGIFIMTNGASNAAIQALTNQINTNGWSGYINRYIFPGGTNIYAPQPDDIIQRAMELYTAWQQGQMPVLYASPVAPDELNIRVIQAELQPLPPGIGLAAVDIVAIIGAVVAAIVALVKLIMGFVNDAKASKARLEQHPPIAPVDFRMQYQTSDGCYIGYTSQCSSGVGKLCNGGFECNPDLLLPANQPPNNNFTENGGGGSSNMLKVGAGVLVVGGILMLASSNNSDGKKA